jgi:hypothetical protein
MAGVTPIADVPDAPTIGAATNVGTSRAYNNGSATVAYTAAATGGTPTTFTATSTPGSFTGTGASPITVTGLQSATSYTFAVSAANANGTLTSAASSSITATTVPQAPTIGTATNASGQSYSGSASISVPFTAGATGGATVTGYTVTSSSGATGSGASSPVSVSETVGNPTSTARTYTVTAVNANGTSAASSASNSIAAVSVPQAPTIGAATAGASSATVAYTANATGGAAVSTFTATSSPGGFTGTGASPITVSGLTNGTAYTFTVTATNSAGTSAASSASSSVTPALPVYAYSNGGINNSNRMYKSTNSGVSWTATGYLTSGSSGYGIEGNNSIATNGSGTFVGGGRYSPTPSQQWLYYSTNSGTTWTASNPANTATGDAFPYTTGPAVYGNGLFIVAGNRATNFPARSYYSSNGTSWSFASVFATANRSTNALVFNPFNNTFYGHYEGAVGYRTTDGATWTAFTGQAYNATMAATLGTSAQTVWVTQQGGFSSYSGTAWAANTNPSVEGNAAVTIAAGNSIYVGQFAETNQTATNLLATSADGTSWTMRANPFTGGLKPNRVYFAGDRFYLSGNGNGLATSTNGTTWTQLSNFAFDAGSILNAVVAGQ